MYADYLEYSTDNIKEAYKIRVYAIIIMEYLFDTYKRKGVRL
jgi:hypothetical protein